MNELMDVLPRIFFLAGQDEATRLSFADLASCRTYPKGNILFHDGDPCFAAYVIISGRVKLAVADDEGREFALEVFGAGDVCGLISTLDGGPHTGTAITLSSCLIARIPSDHLNAWLLERPHLQRAVTAVLARMLRQAYQRAGMQALLPVKRRVRAALIEFAQNHGTTRDAQEYVAPRPTHQELAERVGSTRVVVSRVIRELLEEEPWITMEGQTLRIRLDQPEPVVTVRL